MASNFIQAGEARRKMGFRGRKGQSPILFNLLPQLYVPRTGTHLYSTAYIDAFLLFLGDRRPTAYVARSFATTPGARTLIQRMVTQFNTALARGYLTDVETANLLCVDKVTIDNWRRHGLFDPPVTRQQGTYHISSEALRKLIQWRLPEGLSASTTTPAFLLRVVVNNP